MTDTAESVRNAIVMYNAYTSSVHEICAKLRQIGVAYADLLERIEKAPVVQYYSSEDSYVIKGDDRPLYDKRVALVKVEDKP